MELKPLTDREALNELIDFFLGKNWYVVDPLSPMQVNAIAVDTIKKEYTSFLKATQDIASQLII